MDCMLCADPVESLHQDPLNTFAQLGAMIFARQIDQAGEEAAISVPPHEKPGALPLDQAENAHRRFEEFVLGNLQKLVSRVLFQKSHQRFSHVAQGIKAGPRHDVFYLPPEKRNFRWMRTVGCRGIETEKPMLAHDLAVGIETLDADIVEVAGTMHRSARIRLG